MAKNILLTLFFCGTSLVFTPVFASNEPLLLGFNQEVCTAPAPDSFRITGIGGDFIALAWNPVWVGAIHTLEVLENDGTGGWIPLDTFPDLPGGSFTVEGLNAGTEYRFILATNCASGETSEIKTIIDGITLIVDLVINGRNPVSPVPIDCAALPLNKNWVGFKVEYV
ncbi:MAG: fibronectin type III domain-containing protein, partial [Saprospiraceae bacterium]